MVFGLVFTLTACAFGVLMVRSNRAVALPEPGQSGYELMDLLDRHGLTILVGELIGLGFCSVGAIRLDHVRGRRELVNQQPAKSSPAPHPSPLAPDPKADS